MRNKEDTKAFMPTVAIPPGDTIKENMIFLGVNQKELAARLHITEKHLNDIIRGNAPITYEIAKKLETEIGTSVQFWLQLEANYQFHTARLQRNKR